MRHTNAGGLGQASSIYAPDPQLSREQTSPKSYWALPSITGVVCLPESMISVLVFAELASRPVC